MAEVKMVPYDLAELYVLLNVYIRTYKTSERDAELLNEVKDRFENSQSPGESKITLKNPKGAGRPPIIRPEKDAEILKLRSEGKTIREIVEITSCSTGYVHKLIHEHAGSMPQKSE